VFLPLRYPLANLAARRTRTVLTVGVVALVVVATTLFSGLSLATRTSRSI
jgi:cell division protein FtsX